MTAVVTTAMRHPCCYPSKKTTFFLFLAAASATTTLTTVSVRALATTSTMAAAADLNKMALSESLRSSLPDLYSAPMRPIDLAVGRVQEADQSVELREAARSHAGTVGSIAFVVRRPG